MSKKQNTHPGSLAIGATLIAGLSASFVVQANSNPFVVTALSSGYMVADKGAEGQCGANKRVTEAECGANKTSSKANEGECGANKPAQPKPVQEAKCGEAKCGSNK